jgi:hypothetical protein
MDKERSGHKKRSRSRDTTRKRVLQPPPPGTQQYDNLNKILKEAGVTPAVIANDNVSHVWLLFGLF